MSNAKTSQLKGRQAQSVAPGALATNEVKVVLPQNTTTSLAQITPQVGSIAYDSTQQKVVVNDGTGFVAVGSGSLPAFANGAVPFGNGTGLTSDATKLFFNPSALNGTLVVGDNSPQGVITAAAPGPSFALHDTNIHRTWLMAIDASNDSFYIFDADATVAGFRIQSNPVSHAIDIHPSTDNVTDINTNLDMKTHIIRNVVDPVNPQEVATKNYVDATKNLSAMRQTNNVDTTVTNADSVLLLNSSNATQNVNLPAGVNGLRFDFLITDASLTAGCLYTLVLHGSDTFSSALGTGDFGAKQGIIFFGGVWYLQF